MTMTKPKFSATKPKATKPPAGARKKGRQRRFGVPNPRADENLPPSAAEAARIQASAEKVKSRRRAVEVKLEFKDGNLLKLGPPHSDVEGWAHRMNEAMGTSSANFSNVMLAYVVNAMRPRTGSLPENALNAALAIFNGAELENEIESMLVGQMIATNHAAMDFIGRAIRSDRADHMAEYGNLATKLQRTFVAQIEALARLRRGGEQVVKVVHVHEGGQAVIGDVHTSGGGGGPLIQSQGQPHALASPSLAPLLGANASGNVVPIAGHAERPMPDARRQVAGRPKGKS